VIPQADGIVRPKQWRGKTVEAYAHRMGLFLGYLTSHGHQYYGGAVPKDELSLALIFSAELIGDYIRWKNARLNAEGLVAKPSSTDVDLFEFARAFLHYESGWVRAHETIFRPQIARAAKWARGLPADGQNQAWGHLADTMFDALTRSMVSFRRVQEKKIDPRARIRTVLDEKECVKVLLTMSKALRQDYAKAEPKSDIWRLAIRHIFFVELIAQTGLRVATISQLTWRPDNSGMLHKRNGRWFLLVDKAIMKNGDSRGLRSEDSRTFPLDLMEEFAEITDLYIDEVRQFYLKQNEAETDRVLVTENGKPFSPAYLSNTFRNLTERTVGACAQDTKWVNADFGTHAVRHILATDLARREGMTQSADALRITISEAERTYGELRFEDRRAAMEIALKTALLR
jgi:integrase